MAKATRTEISFSYKIPEFPTRFSQQIKFIVSVIYIRANSGIENLVIFMWLKFLISVVKQSISSTQNNILALRIKN